MVSDYIFLFYLLDLELIVYVFSSEIDKDFSTAYFFWVFCFVFFF